VLDGTVTEPILDRPGVVAGVGVRRPSVVPPIGKRVPTSVPKHMGDVA